MEGWLEIRRLIRIPTGTFLAHPMADKEKRAHISAHPSSPIANWMYEPFKWVIDWHTFGAASAITTALDLAGVKYKPSDFNGPHLNDDRVKEGLGGFDHVYGIYDNWQTAHKYTLAEAVRASDSFKQEIEHELSVYYPEIGSLGPPGGSETVYDPRIVFDGIAVTLVAQSEDKIKAHQTTFIESPSPSSLKPWGNPTENHVRVDCWYTPDQFERGHYLFIAGSGDWGLWFGGGDVAVAMFLNVGIYPASLG